VASSNLDRQRAGTLLSVPSPAPRTC
jgi:hypothetical protein